MAVLLTCPAVADAAFNPEGEQPIVIEGRRRQVGEHAPVAPSLGDRSIDRAPRREAEVARRVGRSRSNCRPHDVQGIPAGGANLKYRTKHSRSVSGRLNTETRRPV